MPRLFPRHNGFDLYAACGVGREGKGRPMTLTTVLSRRFSALTSLLISNILWSGSSIPSHKSKTPNYQYNDYLDYSRMKNLFTIYTEYGWILKGERTPLERERYRATPCAATDCN